MNALFDPLLWLAVLFLGLTGGFAVTLHGMLYGARARLQRRINGMIGPAGRKSQGSDGAAEPDRRRAVAGKLKELDANRRRQGRRPSIKQMIAQAGLEISVAHFIIGSVLSGAVLTGGALAMALPMVGIVSLGIVGGIGLPRLVLKFLAKRRINRFTALFADAIDVIVRGIRSGLPVSETLNIITREMPDPLGYEFRLIVEGQRLGLTLEEALNRACERIPTAELRFFTIVLAIQQSTGGNLAETLAKLSEVLRGRKRMRDKVTAMSSEARSSAMIIGSLPPAVAAMLAAISPGYIGILFTDRLGHLVLFVGTCFASIGIMVMRKMINFEI